MTVQTAINFTIKQLHIFSVVAETGSFNRAATQLYLTQPAVSQQITSLEACFGVSLVKRSPRGITLTSQGEVLLKYVQRILLLAQDAHKKVTTNGDDLASRLTIVTTPGIGVYLLPRWISCFKQIRFDVTAISHTAAASACVKAINSGQADLALVEGELGSEPAGLQVIELVQEKMFLTVPPNHPWWGVEYVPARKLNGQPLVCREKNSATAQFVEQKLMEAHVSRNVVARFDTFEGLKSAVILGVGIAFAPRMSVRREIATGQLHTLRLSDLEMTRALKLVYLHLDNPAARCFITNCLAAEFPHLLTQLFSPEYTNSGYTRPQKSCSE